LSLLWNPAVNGNGKIYMKTSKNNLKNTIRDLTDAITLKCIDCVCYQPKEILKCPIPSCPLWKLRPAKLRGTYILKKRLLRNNIKLSEANNH
jgi:hypothetical protein